MTPKPFPAEHLPELWDKIRAKVFDTERYLGTLEGMLIPLVDVLDLCAGQGTVPFLLGARGVKNHFFLVDNDRFMAEYTKRKYHRFDVLSPGLLGEDIEFVGPYNPSIGGGLHVSYVVDDVRNPKQFALQAFQRYGFPHVTCFGNSLPYLGSWDGRKVDASQAFANLRAFMATVEMYLWQRDSDFGIFLLEYKKESEEPHEEDLGEIEIRGQLFTVKWHISYTGRIRTWAIDLEGKESYHMEMNGFNYTRKEIEEAANKVGLQNINVIEEFPGSPYSMYVMRRR